MRSPAHTGSAGALHADARALADAAGAAAALFSAAEHDEQDARAARDRYRSGLQQPIPPPAELLPHLEESEILLAFRPTSLLVDFRRAGPTDAPLTAGPMYLTDHRLLWLGRPAASVDLRTVEEVALGGELLLVSLTEGDGFVIAAPQPRLLRVHVAAALREVRRQLVERRSSSD